MTKDQLARLKNVFFIRHSESQANLDPELYRFGADSVISLTPAGIQQSIDLGQALRSKLKITKCRMIVSPLTRCLATASIAIQSSGLSIDYAEIDARLAEFQCPLKFSPTPISFDYAAWLADPKGVRYKRPDTLSFHDLILTTQAFLRDLIASDLGSEATLLFTHHQTINALAASVRMLYNPEVPSSYYWMRNLYQPNASVVSAEETRRWELPN